MHYDLIARIREEVVDLDVEQNATAAVVDQIIRDKVLDLANCLLLVIGSC